MTGERYAMLEDRGVLAVMGDDARTFLQGLVSNDIRKVSADRAIYAAFLTPQGKYLHDFFIAGMAGALLLDCEGARRDDLRKRLGAYKLRAHVEITDKTSELAVAALFGDGAAAGMNLEPKPGCAAAFADGAAYMDPRLALAGVRLILPRNKAAKALADLGFKETPFADYDRLRIGLGLPGGSLDLEVGQAILLENGFDELNGVDWNKGCYLGQELTARTKHRGLAKKRLVPVAIEGKAPDRGKPVTMDGAEVGEMRSSLGQAGLALLRLDAMEKSPVFVCGEAKITVRKQGWMSF